MFTFPKSPYVFNSPVTRTLIKPEKIEFFTSHTVSAGTDLFAIICMFVCVRPGKCPRDGNAEELWDLLRGIPR